MLYLNAYFEIILSISLISWLNKLPEIEQLMNMGKTNKDYENDEANVRPIFIVGVPRCGSTLVEKIIASGAKYIPIGEETAILHIFIKRKILKKEPLNINKENFRIKIIEDYKKIGLIQEKNDYTFTDKSLENFFYIHLVKEIFPYAKVINCRRNAISSIVSIFQNNLTELAWTHDLENIFKYFNNYFEIIKNFNTVDSDFI